MLTSLISAGYYLPVVMAVYMREPADGESHAGAGLPGSAVLTVAVAVVIVLLVGVLPASALASAMDTAGSLGPAGATPIAGFGR